MKDTIPTNHHCAQCTKAFTTPQGLALHKRRAHGDLKGSPRNWNKTKPARKVRSDKGKSRTLTSMTTAMSMADVTANYIHAAEIAAALAFLRQHGTVKFKEHNV